MCRPFTGARDGNSGVVKKVNNKSWCSCNRLWFALPHRELAEIIGRLAALKTFRLENDMILANTTLIGMQRNIDDTLILRKLWSHALVFDVIYTPKITILLWKARECGALTVTWWSLNCNMVEMFIGQAYEQYERFTGLPAPKELFREAMESY
ncbi:hypothetical protein SSX86_021934 [Deinandra increscens subsp. villosa]|uniref:SDH C-terminal domain-containing protein n=1 Tax=Deinandra increscens subsp. villosa TaxID=3103831 RepID=A0AAP0CS19_9ASTR